MKQGIVYGVVTTVMLFGGIQTTWAGEIDCSTAKEDIAQLESEKKKAESKKSKGLFSYTPIGMVAGAMTDSEKSGGEKDMHVDEYNDRIDRHIAKIRSACPDVD